MRKYDSLPPNLPPRGLSRNTAANYVGISVCKFDELVQRGQMPPAKRIDGRRIWDRNALDKAFEALPASGSSEANAWDETE